MSVSDLSRDSIPRLISSRSPVLIFEVDAHGAGREHAASARRSVRLVGCVRRSPPALLDAAEEADGVSALLVLRSLSPARLLSFVGSVSRGDGELTSDLFAQLQPSAGEGPAEPLTSRELAVLRMLADGETTRGIAEQLNYCERTVKNIVRGLLEKLNCRTRAQAVALATRCGVI